MRDVPSGYALVLLALAAFRAWKLLAEDTILDGPRDRLLAGRNRLAELVECPWCLGFWLSILAWLAWLASHRWTLICATPLAVSALVGLLTVGLNALAAIAGLADRG